MRVRIKDRHSGVPIGSDAPSVGVFLLLLLVCIHHSQGASGSPAPVAAAAATAMDMTMAEKDAGKSWKGPDPASPLSPPIVFESGSPSNTDGISPRVAARKLNRNTTLKVTETDIKGRPQPLGFAPVEDDSTKSIRLTRSNGNGGGSGRGGNGMENGRNHSHHHFRHHPQQQHNMYKRAAANQPTKTKPATAATPEDMSSTAKGPVGFAPSASTTLCRNRRGIDERGSYNGSRILGWSANKNRNNNGEPKTTAGDLGGREIAASALSAKVEPKDVLTLGNIRNSKDVVTPAAAVSSSTATPDDVKNKQNGKPTSGPAGPEKEPTTPTADGASTPAPVITTATAKPNSTRKDARAKLFSANK